jgi:hypothetical protein
MALTAAEATAQLANVNTAAGLRPLIKHRDASCIRHMHTPLPHQQQASHRL